jgi:hypothetical protein
LFLVLALYLRSFGGAFFIYALERSGLADVRLFFLLKPDFKVLFLRSVSIALQS